MNQRSRLRVVAFGAMLAAWMSASAVSQGEQAAPARVAAAPPAAPQEAPRSYVGSQACQKCHAATYARWSKTRMANVVTDPKLHPEVIIPDLSKPDPLVTFTRNDIAFVYGTRWKQRYFKKVGDDYFPLGAQ